MASKKLTWAIQTIRLGDIEAWEDNPRMSTKRDAERLVESESEFGRPLPFVVNPPSGGKYPLLDGHQRLAAWKAVHGEDYEVEANVASRKLTRKEQEKLTIMLHAGAVGQWNWDALASWNVDELQLWGLDTDLKKALDNDANNIKELLASETVTDDEPPVPSDALNDKWQVKRGDLWRIGEHRLLCGDSTNADDVARVMGGEKATLVMADPPYGMGKESEGVENDNLYNKKLDEFQMRWWKAARLCTTDNGSAYIWGTAESLWRLWYVGGLCDSERLTWRNEIVWYKGSGQGMTSERHRMYATASERCLFFVIGEQGYNNNADNYWEGFEPIRAYLDEQRQICGWDGAKVKRIVGHSENSGLHWFTASQWAMPTRKVYEALQKAANGKAFILSYDELMDEFNEVKAEFYASRATFDNTHDSMTDVWQFCAVLGKERWGHPTPKPVEMMERILKTSCVEGGVALSPFAGSGVDLVAAQNTGRKCRAIEISTDYCAVILERMAAAFPDIDITRVEEGEG